MQIVESYIYMHLINAIFSILAGKILLNRSSLRKANCILRELERATLDCLHDYQTTTPLCLWAFICQLEKTELCVCFCDTQVQSGRISNQHCILVIVPWNPDPQCESDLETGWTTVNVWHADCMGAVACCTYCDWCTVGKKQTNLCTVKMTTKTLFLSRLLWSVACELPGSYFTSYFLLLLVSQQFLPLCSIAIAKFHAIQQKQQGTG